MPRKRILRSGICLACEKHFSKYPPRGPFLKCCDNGTCIEEVREMSRDANAQKANDLSAKVYTDANIKFLPLDHDQKQNLFALLYEDIKQNYLSIPPSFRDGMSDEILLHLQNLQMIKKQSENPNLKLVIEDKKELAARFNAFCVEYRGTSAIALFKKYKTKTSIGRPQDVQDLIKKIETNLGYDSESFCKNNTTDDVISWLVGTRKKLPESLIDCDVQFHLGPVVDLKGLVLL